jgi:hypothetical protein
MIAVDHAVRSWDVGRLSRALNATPVLVQDETFGHGLRYGLGEHDALTLELYPPASNRRTGIVCLATADLVLTLFKQRMPAVAEDQLLFHTADAVLSLAASGEMRLFRATD